MKRVLGNGTVPVPEIVPDALSSEREAGSGGSIEKKNGPVPKHTQVFGSSGMPTNTVTSLSLESSRGSSSDKAILFFTLSFPLQY
eukprot:13753_1